MAFEDLVDVAYRILEPVEVFAMVLGQRDFGEHRLRVPKLFEAQVRAVAGELTALLEPLDADEAGARGKRHRIGEVDIGHATVLLQLRKDAQIDPVQLERFHGDLPAVSEGLILLQPIAARTSGASSTWSSVRRRRLNNTSNSASVYVSAGANPRTASLKQRKMTPFA